MNTAGRGADTQSRFHYQSGYGVIILSEMLQDPIGQDSALWCEHCDDFLLENADGSFEAIQVKTCQARNWTLNNTALLGSLTRFLSFDRSTSAQFVRFRLVSNIRFPQKLDQLIEFSSTHSKISLDAFPDDLLSLSNNLSVDPSVCLSMLRKLSLVVGPELRDWRPTIICRHVAKMPGFVDGQPARANLTLSEAERVFRALYALVERASESDEPSTLEIMKSSPKRIAVAEAYSVIYEVFDDISRLRATQRRDLDFPYVVVPPLLLIEANDSGVSELNQMPIFGHVSRLDLSDLITQPGWVSDVCRRAVINCEALERFHSATKHMTTKPPLRVYGNFTSLSTDRTSNSDYDALIRTESEYLRRFIRDGYPVLIFANLLPSHILENWTDGKKMWSRVEAMTEQLQRLEDAHKNLQFTIDTANRFPSRFILGESLLIDSAVCERGVGYTRTFYTNSAEQIAQSKASFDYAFRGHRVIERAVRHQLHIDKSSGYLTTVFTRRAAFAQI